MLLAADGSVAECHIPFPPLPPMAPAWVAPAGALAGAVAAHAAAARTVGVLLVRLGGYAAGVFTGQPPALAASKTGSRRVHGRSAAGGWSQHRFARRREQQAAAALDAAAAAAAATFGPRPGNPLGTGTRRPVDSGLCFHSFPSGPSAGAPVLLP